ncbi:hypothetical protein HOLleu_16618 [Holothuria leucospilota]|uniref:Uncharacterized protein n=1 Tax=Holothuria leucospilota TaxID=206669 RepID=A0A9Q1C5J3_HOLLE|nr:hypothetical protein HOLleu_16618 [Holothuria leucospilota]
MNKHLRLAQVLHQRFVSLWKFFIDLPPSSFRDTRGGARDKQHLQDILAKVPYEDLDTRDNARDKQRLQDILAKVPYEDLDARGGTMNKQRLQDILG